MTQELSDEQKRELDHILETVQQFLATEEGKEAFDRLESISNSIQARQGIVELSSHERQALRFIQTEQGKGRNPSVRQISKSLGFRSSRTGHKILKSLRTKGVIPKLATEGKSTPLLLIPNGVRIRILTTTHGRR